MSFWRAALSAGGRGGRRRRTRSPSRGRRRAYRRRGRSAATLTICPRRSRARGIEPTVATCRACRRSRARRRRPRSATSPIVPRRRSPRGRCSSVRSRRRKAANSRCRPSVVVGLAGEDLVARGRAARAARPARAGGAASSARATAGGRRRSSSRPNGPPMTKHRSRPLIAALLEEAAEARRSPCASPSMASSETNARSGIRRSTALVLADLDELEPRVAGRAAARSAATSSANGGRSRPTATTTIRTLRY